MENSKESAKSTDSTRDKILAHLGDYRAMAAVIDVFTTTIPETYDLRYPDGPQDMQIEAIAGFIVKKFRTFTVNELLEAFELNAACQLPERVEFYGKLNLNTIGSLLFQFRQYKANSGLRGRLSDAPPPNIEAELVSDVHNILNSGDNWNLTIHVSEKWDWLKANRNDFKPTWDEKELSRIKKEMIEAREARKKIDGLIRLPDKYFNPDTVSVNEYKCRLIRQYLNILADNYKKRQKDEGNE